MTKYIIAFGRAWIVTPQAYKEIQEILLSIYGTKSESDKVLDIVEEE